MFVHLLLALALTIVVGAGPAQARQSGPATVDTTATLSVLAGSVQRVPSGSTQPEPAVDGQSLAVGDRIITAAGSTALVTFLDGSTLTVQPETDVEIRVASMDQQRSTIGIHINFGTVWARVVSLLDPGSSFTLESNAGVASVHDGLPGAQVAADGTFTCWTRAGELRLAPSNGQPEVVLQPGEKAIVQQDSTDQPEPFAVNQSELLIVAPTSVLPLLLMPDGARLAGFVAPGIEVNQVFGSRTRLIDGGFEIRVPAGVPGPYTLILEGLEPVQARVRLVGSVGGESAYERDLDFAIQPGERLVTEIKQQIDPATAADPRNAVIQAAELTPLEPFQGPLPGKVLLSPSELQAVESGQ